MTEVKDESVHLIITSPPYWQLKDYGVDSQIGFNDSYEDYINNLNLVWKESYRVLHPGCRLCINIGDQFARSVYYGRYKIIPIRTEIIKFCEEIGFDYMGAIIWQKVTTTNTTGGATIMGSFPYPRNGIIKLDYEFILIFKKIGTPPKVAPNIKLQSKLTKQEWNEYFQGHWNFGGAKQDKHLAMFPEELPKRLIKMFSFVGDTVLDPFLGSGTTSLAAKNLNRNSIGYEINQEFIPVIMNKISNSPSPLFNEFDIELYEQSKIQRSFNNEILQQPYIYKDPHKLNNKIDIHKLQYGSKVDKNSSKRSEYFSVKEVISPELIKLNNDIVIRLIGIKPKKSTIDKAKEFIYNYTKGKKVFIRHDNLIYDENNNLLCYLYLKNKTFINAHLLKCGLAEIDDSYDFRYRIKFLKLKDVCGGDSQ